MAEETIVTWPMCEQAECRGIRLASGPTCLAHSNEETITAALKLVSETGLIDARGVPLSRTLLQQVLTAAPRGANGKPLIRKCQFDKATFTELADFSRATFRGEATFAGATFRGTARFFGAN